LEVPQGLIDIDAKKKTGEVMKVLIFKDIAKGIIKRAETLV
jgi:hypothetical protein